MVLATFPHLTIHSTRHDIPRSQIFARVVTAHEGFALPVSEHGAFAAQSLGDQEGVLLGRVERGGVELDELHVRADGAGAVRQGDAVAGGDGRIGGVAVERRAAARRQHGGAGAHGDRLVGIDIEHPGADTAAAADVAFGLEREDHVILEHSDTRMARNGAIERVLDRSACLVLAVDDARPRVAAFDAEGEVSFRARETYSPVDQVGDGLWPAAHQRIDAIEVTETGAGL